MENERNEQPNQIKEEAVAYSVYGEKKQGEYTLEDYYAIPDDRRVELIDGVIYDMAAPSAIHQHITSEIGYEFKKYVKEKKGKCKVFSAPFDIQLDRDNRTMVQPDVIVMCNRENFRERNYFGAPDLVVEVLSPSTRKKDMTIKLRKYQAAGVREYWIVDPKEKRVIVYEFEKQIPPVVYGFSGKIPVGIFGGVYKVDIRTIVEEWEGFIEGR